MSGRLITASNIFAKKSSFKKISPATYLLQISDGILIMTHIQFSYPQVPVRLGLKRAVLHFLCSLQLLPVTPGCVGVVTWEEKLYFIHTDTSPQLL